MRTRHLLIVATLALVAVGCGGSKQSAQPATTAPTATAPATTTAGPAPIQPEARSTAAGDVPDNQAFLVFGNAAAGYSIRYPEGWAQQGRGPTVTFRDKNNIVRIVVATGPAPTIASVQRDLRASGVTVRTPASAVTVSGAAAIKAVYSTESAPSPVTGKRVTLVVDRYYLSHAGKQAVVDLGSPDGVDNVDAYRLMVESLRWK